MFYIDYDIKIQYNTLNKYTIEFGGELLMTVVRSFAEYVKKKCYNGLYSAAEEYLASNWELLGLRTSRVHKIGTVELTDAYVERVYVRDLPDMMVAFEVGLELEVTISESDYHYDNTDVCYPWVRITCRGDLTKGLDDWVITKVEPYSKNKMPANSLSDALVPCISHDQLERTATQFLRENYPETLNIPAYGQPPVYVDPYTLAKRLGLNVRLQRIRDDATVFGQLYFADADAEMFDEDQGKSIVMHIEEKTIVVDPQMYLLRSLGSVNNTIVHECVHWVKHRKVFELEKLYNADASSISCEVVGGAASKVCRDATEQMERQANQLAPRIQMPKDVFIARAKEHISRFMRETNAKHEVEVMELVIAALETDFLVSRQAAKIRMVELGFEQAIGTYTYLDDHYVKPHGFRKGAISVNQTFSISAADGAIERFLNPEFRKLTETGDYLFIDNHYVFNAPLYVQPDETGRLDLTDYARAHMDECCLVFDMKIISKVGADHHTACFLNREPSDVTFELKFHNGYQSAPQERQVEMRKKQQADYLRIRQQMTDDQAQCLKLLLDWRGKNYTELAADIDRNPKTISRIVNGETDAKLSTAVLICFGLNLPPILSEKLLDVLNCKLKPLDPNHQWIKEALFLKYPEPLWSVLEYLEKFGVDLTK